MSSSAARREAADAFIGSGGPAKRPGFAERRRLARARGSSSARQKTAETLLASPEAEGTCWVMTTADGKEITHASPQWHETWHYSPDETIGKSPTILNGEGSDIDASRVHGCLPFAEGLSTAPIDVASKLARVSSSAARFAPESSGAR